MYFYLKKPNANKATPINLLYYIGKEEKYFKYPIGKSIHPDEWNFDNRLPKTARGATGIKSKHLLSILTQYSNLLDQLIQDCERTNTFITKEYLRSQFDLKFKQKKVETEKVETEKAITNVAEAIDLFIFNNTQSEGMSKSWVFKYRNLKNKILFFGIYKSKHLLFSDITDDWLKEYSGFLRSFPKLMKNDSNFRNEILKYCLENKIKVPKTGYNDNTLNRHIKFLKTFLKWSKKKYHNIDLDDLENTAKAFNPDKAYITSEEIEKLEKVSLSRPSLIRVRDLFLIGIYSGQRYSDYSVFEKADVKNGLIIKKAEKTEEESFIPLHDDLKNILDKYEWNLPVISEQKFNDYIQEVCREADIMDVFKKINYRGNKKDITYHQKCDEVRSHTARATFITLSSEGGMPDHIIQKITGIKDTKTLAIYKKTSQNSVKEWGNKVWTKKK